MHRSLLLSLLLLLACSPFARAEDPLVGKRVVVIRDKATLEASGKEVAKVSECSIFTVGSVEGSWLWIKSERAYLRRADVVPFDEAIGHYTRLLETNKTAHNYWNRAQIWRLKGELDIALGDMNDAIRLNSTVSAWFNHRGILWDDKKDYDKAIADYSEAIRLNPKSGEAYNNRGRAWSAKKDYDKAIADYDEALKYKDSNAKVGTFNDSDITGGDSTAMVNSRAMTLNNRGSAWDDKKDYDKAIADYEEAIRLDPKFQSPRSNRRSAWGELKAWDKLIADCEDAIRENAKDATLFNWRGHAWSQKGDYDKAVADYEEVIRLDPKNEYARNNRRSAWVKKGDWEKVIVDYEATLKEGSPTAETCNSLAWLRATCPVEKHRNGRQAVEYATKACELTAWKDAAYLDTLAAAYAEAEDFDKAVEWQKKGMDLAPADQKADYETRVKLYQEKKPYRDSAK